MRFSVTAYNNLQLGTYQLEHLQELKIVEKVNEHSKLYFTGIVPEENKDSYVEMTQCETPIQMEQVDEAGRSTPIFKGIVTNIGVKSVRGIYYVEGEAISNSYKLDIKLKSRSFQDKGMSYEALISNVISQYSGADYIDTASNGASIGKFTLQYNETDWQFLKRMASRFNKPLVPESVSDKPKFWFGRPNRGLGGNLEEYNYSVSKKIADYRTSSQNFNPGIQENDFVYYEVESKDKIFSIGSEVQFKGKSLYVYQAVTTMKDSILKHLYTIAPEKGLSQNTLYNDQIIGLSLEGKVISVANDNVKAHLEIDDSYGLPDVYWFNYSSVYTAEGNSGWYCMPEKGDHVRIYFPDNKEENCIAVSSVRKNLESGGHNKLSNPDIKCFRTKDGKELMFSPDKILIIAKDNDIFIKLDENGGIEIMSTKEIKIVSQEDIKIDSEKKVLVVAKEEIDIKCGEKANINLKGSSNSISITGNEVKTN